ncbi:MAG: ATP-dependent zinc protease, partial [Gammaproteobacteria bacterium]|nr:ATP-dependent zinc protease [Gammaproteobacteria bacterium]
MTHDSNQDLHWLGWREWASLPELGIDQIKCKVDTGARTSALHAFKLEPFQENGLDRVRFLLHPLQGNDERVIQCCADIHDQRIVTDSGGHREKRLVIKTPVRLGNHLFSIELTLTDRDTMKFRMLLGR